jgi:serine phosphatase RsbU (regulator of sigma subunit)
LNAWYEVRAWPNPDGLAVYFIDVTDRRAAEQSAQRAINRAGLVAQVSEELAGALEPEDAVGRLAKLIVPALGTWCVVTLIDDDRRGGTRQGLGYAWGWHADPALRDLAERYARIRLSVISDDSLVTRAVETGHLQVINDNALDVLAGMFPVDSEPIRILRAFDTQAVAVLPLPGQERTVGMLSVGADASRGPFSTEDVDLLREVAARAGLVLDRARLYRQQRAVAETLQRSLLQVPPPQSGVQVAVRYVPAAEVAQVGGDWYDTLARPDGSAVLVIGDVMGHDVMAAAAMSEIRALVRTLAARSGSDPAAVLDEAERVMGVLHLDALATVVVGRLEPPQQLGAAETTRRFRFSNAGHPPPLVLGPGGEVRVLSSESSDPLLGMSWPDRTDRIVELAPGSTIVLYTDGLVEQRDQPLDRGVQRLVDVLTAEGSVDPETLCDKVLAALKPDRSEDDIALLIARLSD